MTGGSDGPGTSESDPARHRRQLDVIERGFAAVSAGDVDVLLRNFTDDAVLEMPYADPSVRLEGKGAIRSRLGPALGTFRFRLEITTVYQCTDPDTLVLEYTSEGHAVPTGHPYRNSYVGVFRFRSGLICFQREYYNPVPAQRAMTPTPDQPTPDLAK